MADMDPYTKTTLAWISLLLCVQRYLWVIQKYLFGGRGTW